MESSKTKINRLTAWLFLIVLMIIANEVYGSVTGEGFLLWFLLIVFCILLTPLLFVIREKPASTACVAIDSDTSFDYDMQGRELKWKLESDVEVQYGEVNLRLVNPLRRGEGAIEGKELLERAKKISALVGQHHAEALSKSQNVIPEEWKEYMLIFPGTVWLTPNGGYYMPYLYWLENQNCWLLSFGRLDRDFGSHNRLVCPKN